jgi:hypothetical protein
MPAAPTYNELKKMLEDAGGEIARLTNALNAESDHYQRSIEHGDEWQKPAEDLQAVAEATVAALEAEVERLKAWIISPPKHDFWGAGEPNCPRDIKAGNGELHTLRCKVCGLDGPRDPICRGAS